MSEHHDEAAVVDREYDAVVFDNDGVLVERTDRGAMADAVAAAFEAVDAEPAEEFVREFLAPKEFPEARLREDHGVDPERFWTHREAEVAALQREAVLTGEKALYDDARAIAELDHPLGLVSNNHHEIVEFVLDHHDLGDHFETVYGRRQSLDELERKKPATHYLDRALDDLGTRNALYVGDSETDVVAADRAGIDAAFVRRPHRADASLSVEPTYEVPDLRTLVDGLAATARR